MHPAFKHSAPPQPLARGLHTGRSARRERLALERPPAKEEMLCRSRIRSPRTDSFSP